MNGTPHGIPRRASSQSRTLNANMKLAPTIAITPNPSVVPNVIHKRTVAKRIDTGTAW